MEEKKKDKVKKVKYADLITKIGKLTLLELNELVKEMQEHFQIDLSLATSNSQAGKVEEEAKKNELDVILTEIGKSKIAVIKVISKITEKSLLETKKMIDNLPITLVSKQPETEAKKLKKEIEAAGATIKLE